MNEHLGDGKKVQLRSSESVWSASAHSVRAGGSSEQHSYREVSWLLENKLSNSPGLSSLPLENIFLLLKVPSANVHTVHPAAYLPREQRQANTDSWKIPAPVGGWAAGIILGHRKGWMNAGMGMPCPQPAWSLCHVEAPRCFIMPCFLTEEQNWLPLCVLL